MDVPAFLATLDAERRSLVYDGSAIEQLPHVTRGRSTDGSHRWVAWSSLDASSADDAIAAEVAHHASLGVAFEWKAYAHDGPADLLDRLAASGFAIGPREAVMAYDLAGSPLGDGAIVAGEPAITVERVDRVEQVDVYRRTAAEAFGKDYAFTATQLAEAIAAGSTQHRGYVGCINGEPAGVGRLYLHPGSVLGGLYGGGTRPAFRGRGVYGAIVAARARDAAAAGARYLVVDALPTSRPILERLGFQHVTDTWPCEWTPASRV